MLGGRKVRSNKGKKRGSYRTRKTHHSVKVRVSAKGKRSMSRRKVRSNKGKKRGTYGPRTGRTRSGRKFRGGLLPDPEPVEGGGVGCGAYYRDQSACEDHSYCKWFEDGRCEYLDDNSDDGQS
jgi:hypothetical protein